MEWRLYFSFFLGMYGSWFFIITNRASDRYSEHSKREYRDWQDWGLTLEALPLRGGGNAECPKKDKRRVRRGSREQKHAEHTNQSIWVNESSVNPKSTSNQSRKPCTVLQYPSKKNILWVFVLVSGLSSFELYVKAFSHTSTVHATTVSRFLCNFFRMWIDRTWFTK